jgi:hypothetical protein
MRLIGQGRAAPLTATVAVVATMLVGGGAYATAATVITGKNVRDSSLTGHDVRNGSLTSSDVKARSLQGTDIRRGTLTVNAFRKGTLLRGAKGATGGTGGTGATGARGAAGVRGARGDSGVADLLVVKDQGSSAGHSALVRCPAGRQAVSGGGETDGHDAVTQSSPVVDADGRPVGWKVSVEGGTPTAFAVCAAAE